MRIPRRIKFAYQSLSWRLQCLTMRWIVLCTLLWYSEIESFSGTVHVLVEVLDAQAKRIEHAKLKVNK